MLVYFLKNFVDFPATFIFSRKTDAAAFGLCQSVFRQNRTLKNFFAVRIRLV